MGNRKRQSAQALKEAKKSLAFAKLNNCPTSPRKMRLVADQVSEKANLFVSEIRVDGGSMLKRLRPAPQGRAHRIRKRSNHVTVVVGSNTIEA
jgi:large subunit ribosomal protein L22